MTHPAVGIHAHSRYKTGLRPMIPGRPVIRFSTIRSDKPITAPVVPNEFTDSQNITYGLDHNDEFGVCGPTSLDNFRRTVSYLLTGSQVNATWDDIIKWYRASGNPDFDPSTGADDNGVNLQIMLEAMVKMGVIRAFAAVDVTNEAELREANWLFLGLILGVNLQVAQQEQTDAKPPRWDFSNSAEWGGHAICQVDAQADGDDVAVSWAKLVEMSPAFCTNQRLEAYVALTDWHLQHPLFREGVSLDMFKSEYTRLTGRPFPA